MLKESKQVRQIAGEDHRRWFSDQAFDLIVWEKKAGDFSGFQLCYLKNRDEHALIWQEGKDMLHYRVDSGEPGPLKNLSPMMAADGVLDITWLKQAFIGHSNDIDNQVRDLVLEKLAVYSPEEPKAKDLSKITILGDEGQGGVYLLGIEVSRNVAVAFGRYNGGEPVEVLAGEYVYIGAAHGQRGAASLGSRLVRHATRSGGKFPHRIRPVLASQLDKAGLGRRLPVEKSPHWHVDHLLDEAAAEIERVILARTEKRIEKKLARLVEEMPGTVVFAPGLGASDHPGGTHLLRVEAPEGWWWEKLVEIVEIVG